MHIIVFVTASSKKEAKKIAAGLLEKKHAACVNIISNIDSYFWWQGKIDTAKESLLIIKTRKFKLPGVIKTVKSLHSYEVPEIIAISVVAGERSYLRWIDGSVRNPD